MPDQGYRVLLNMTYFHHQAAEKSEGMKLSMEQLTNEKTTLETQVSSSEDMCGHST